MNVESMMESLLLIVSYLCSGYQAQRKRQADTSKAPKRIGRSEKVIFRKKETGRESKEN